MEKKLRYKPPSGATISNPSMATLRSAIFNANHADWDEREAMLDFYETDIRLYKGDVSLIYFYDEPYGFFLYYEVSLAPVPHDVDLKDDVVVEHIVGCEPMRIPSICYRSKEEAWEIIEHFIATEKTFEKFNWVMLGDIDYKRE
jgi:hypothetical protein